MVIVFMLATYGLFGLFANIAVAINVAMIFGVLSMLNATLTLPGIAGIVLTVGIAVDSNVLIYERIREEVRGGRTPINAIDAGFTRALATILDSNITTFIAAAVLFYHRHRPGARLRRHARHRHHHHGVHRLHPDAADRRHLGALAAPATRADLGGSFSAPASHRTRRHQIRFHALPAHQLSDLGADVDPGDLALFLPRAQFRHRLQGRHADRGADQGGPGRSRQDALRRSARSASARCSCSNSARPTTC